MDKKTKSTIVISLLIICACLFSVFQSNKKQNLINGQIGRQNSILINRKNKLKKLNTEYKQQEYINSQLVEQGKAKILLNVSDEPKSFSNAKSNGEKLMNLVFQTSSDDTQNDYNKRINKAKKYASPDALNGLNVMFVPGMNQAVQDVTVTTNSKVNNGTVSGLILVKYRKFTNQRGMSETVENAYQYEYSENQNKFTKFNSLGTVQDSKN